MGSGPESLLGLQPTRPPQGPPRWSQARPARARWSRGRRGRLMARAARVPGSGPGRANVRSPRPRAAGAPASTPGADRYASGGGRPGAPPPSGASDCRSGASARCGGGRLNAGRGAPAPDSLQYVPLLAPCPPPSTISLSLSLPIQSWGDWSAAPRGRPRTKAALSAPFLPLQPLGPWESQVASMGTRIRPVGPVDEEAFGCKT